MTTANNITISSTGVIYCNGIAFLVGVGVSTAFGVHHPEPQWRVYYFDNCLFKLADTAAGSSSMPIGSGSAGSVAWKNCTAFFGNAGNFIDISTVLFTWQNTGLVL